MGKSAKAPDYTAAAEAQGQSSKEVTNMQTWANRPDQVTPFGTTTWSPQSVRDPATGQMVTKWTQTTTLPEDQQKALMDQFAITSGRADIAKDLLPRAREEFGNEMDWSNLTDYAGTPQAGAFGQAPTARTYTPENFQRSIDTQGLQNVDPSARYYDEAGDALMQQFEQRNAPIFQRDQEQLDATLRARGLKPGDAAYDAELQKLRQSQADARTNASFQASQLAGQEAARMYGMDAQTRAQQFGERGTAANFANQASQQALMQQLGIGEQEFNQLMALTGLGDQRQQTKFAQDMDSAAYQNTLRQAQLAEEMQKRGFSLNEINALISGQQVGMPTMPGFSQASKSDTVQYMDAAKSQYSAAQDAANAQNAFTNSVMSMAGNLIPS